VADRHSGLRPLSDSPAKDAKDAKSAKVNLLIKEPTAHVDSLAHAVIGAALEVHRFLGPGFAESVYEEALAVELRVRSIPFARQVPIAVAYKGAVVGNARLDILVANELVIELKAVEVFAPVHIAQTISYLRATGHTLALLITFNVPELRRGIRRIAATRGTRQDRQRSNQ
jgi:GxxExxY protein